MIDRAFVMFRIGTARWMDDAEFAALLHLFERHPGVTDDLVFFTSQTHCPLPVGEMKRRADMLAGRS